MGSDALRKQEGGGRGVDGEGVKNIKRNRNIVQSKNGKKQESSSV